MTELEKVFLDAVKSGDIEKTKECLKAKVNINIQTDFGGMTALAKACYYNRIDIVIFFA